MSNKPEIIYIINHDAVHLSKSDGLCMIDACSNPNHLPEYARTEYILKSKYDESLKRIEELEKELKGIKPQRLCDCKNRNMTGGLMCQGNCHYF